MKKTAHNAEGLNELFQPTPKQRNLVRQMAGLGMTLEDMAAIIRNPATGKGIAIGTLRLRFADEIRQGAAETNQKALGNLLKLTETNASAAIFWVKARLGWREKDEQVAREQSQMDQLEFARRVAFILNAAAMRSEPKQIAGVAERVVNTIDQVSGDRA